VENPSFFRILLGAAPNLTALDTAGKALREYPLLRSECAIGSDVGNDLVISDPTVSRRHALVRIIANSWELSDLNSSNGTYLDGRRLTSSAVLHDGARIRFGPSTFVFKAGTPANQSGQWHYERKGERKGPVPKETIVWMYDLGQLNADSLVWSVGLTEWKRLADLPAFSEILRGGPPALPESRISNTFVWWLAVAPILGTASAIVVSANSAIALADLWWIPVALNVGLCMLDWYKLKQAGHEGPGSLLAVLVPLYLIMRSVKLRQTHAYTVVWFVAFLLGFVLELAYTSSATLAPSSAGSSAEPSASGTGETATGDGSAASSGSSKRESGGTTSELANAMLVVRPGIADFGDMRVSALFNCLEHAPKPSRVVSESDKGYGRRVVHLENDKGEWQELNFSLTPPTAMLESIQIGDGTLIDDWSALLILVETCVASAPHAPTSP